MQRATMIGWLLIAGEVLAHPEHGSGGPVSATLSHLLGEPDHLAMILLPVVVGTAWLLLRVLRARSVKRSRSARR